MDEHLITIGELSARTGVAASALRYYEQLGLLAPRARASGRRLYASDATSAVGVIRVLREAHFTLSEIADMTAIEPPAGDVWHALAERKLAELDELIASATAAREALDHARHCRYKDARECIMFWRVVAHYEEGEPLAAAHAKAHARRADGKAPRSPSGAASAPNPDGHALPRRTTT